MDSVEFVELLWENNQSLIQQGEAKRDSRSSSPTAALPNPSLVNDNPTHSNIYTIDLESQRMSTPELSLPISQSSVPTSSKTCQGLYEALLQSRLQKQDVTWVEPSPLPSSRVVNFTHYSRPLAVARATIQSISGLRSGGESASTVASVSGGGSANSNQVNSAITEAGDRELKGKRKIHEQKLDMDVKRTRAGEVHNLSERLRRDRINEKIKALQELIPNCNKVDKASILDEAIEYLKTLQLQLQMMYKQSRQFNPLMMPPSGMQLPQMPTMSDMGMGRGTGLTYAVEMYDSSNVQNFPVPSMKEQLAPGLMGMQASDHFPMYDKLGQGLPVHVPMPVCPPAELPTKPSSLTEISMPATIFTTSDVALYSSSKDQQKQSTDIELMEKGSTKRAMPVCPSAELATKTSSLTEISMPATMLATSDVALYSSFKDQQKQSTDIESMEKGSTKRDNDSDI